MTTTYGIINYLTREPFELVSFESVPMVGSALDFAGISPSRYTIINVAGDEIYVVPTSKHDGFYMIAAEHESMPGFQWRDTENGHRHLFAPDGTDLNEEFGVA